MVGGKPKPICSSVVFRQNSNERRLSLTWAEVTVLEAAHMFECSEEPWGECLECLTDGSQAQQALRRGYAKVADMVWGDVPPFKEALGLAASLDPSR